MNKDATGMAKKHLNINYNIKSNVFFVDFNKGKVKQGA